MKHSFFEHAGVTVITTDRSSRFAAFEIILPASLMQTITPAILGAGVIDQYTIFNPLVAWMPDLGKERFKQGLDDSTISSLNTAINTKVNEVLSLFIALSEVITNQSDIIPMLPMGTYVSFRLRCLVDKLFQPLLELEDVFISGVSEFCFALAGALSDALREFES